MHRLLALALLVLVAPALRGAEPDAAEFFEKRVRPVLAEHCFGCHSGNVAAPKSKLRLDSRAGMLKGGERGPAIVPGDPDNSRLVRAISYKDIDLQMPKRAKLSAAAIADLTAWVKMGAPWPGSASAAAAEAKPGFDLQKRKAEHWAWQPVRPQMAPAVKDAAWPLTAADRFILAKLEAAGLKPAAPVDRSAWLRRVTFDLTGLPPTPTELDAFLRDTSPDAFARVVDRLLASPHFGERWARHWLDLVRYAETHGHEFDPIIPNAYQYRDYVIRALNADVPYNQFVTEHIAGDLLPKPRMSGPDGFNESILGTGFWFLGEAVHSPVDIRGDEADRIDNKIDVFSKTFLGLTVACARCHDHKFDAISQKDYYALSGFILSSAYRQVRFDSMEHNKRIAKELAELRERYRPAIMNALADTIEPASEQLRAKLLAALKAIRGKSSGDTEEVRAWVKYLHAATKDRSDLFHQWALMSVTDVEKIREQFAELRKADNKKENEWGESVGSTSPIASSVANWPWDHTWKPADQDNGIAVDTQAPFEWGASASRPILRFNDRPAFRIDHFWDPILIANGTETDHGTLGAPLRHRILRSTSFTLGSDRTASGKVYLLVRGKGRVYAAVDSHTLIAGPLHGRLLLDFDTGGKWRWITHDLSPYLGHRLHLEVSPSGGDDYAVADAVEADPAPAIEPISFTWNRITSPDPTRPEQFADWYIGLFKWFARSLRESDAWPTMPVGDVIGNFVLEHPDLLGIEDFGKVKVAAEPLFRAQEALAKQVRHVSRLAPAICDVSAVDEHVLIRGSHKSPGEVVPRRFLEVFVGSKGIRETHGEATGWHLGDEELKSLPGSGRDVLARQVTDPAVNPLIARVMVNRVWHHLFGRGIVASVDNFGVMGEKPTHPELLDFLADRFVKEGWSVKTLIRELVLSQTYRMASRGEPAADQADPENKLLHAARLRRLEGEAIRDAMLSVSGRRDDAMYGAPVPVNLSQIAEARGRPPVDGPLDGAGRRSVYVAVRRNFLPPFMLAFDTPSPFSTMGRRTVSNVPAQALILMNDPFVHQQAERWGRRVQAEPGDVGAKVERMYVSAFARRPSAAELARSREFIQTRGANDAKAWADLAHVLMNVKEFIYLP